MRNPVSRRLDDGRTFFEVPFKHSGAPRSAIALTRRLWFACLQNFRRAPERLLGLTSRLCASPSLFASDCRPKAELFLIYFLTE